jgi:putative ATP-binding cassette transporter
MPLLSFLLRSSRRMFAIAVVTGFLSGISSAGIIALINRIVTQAGVNTPIGLLWAFVGLVLVSLVANFICQIVLIRLAQQAIFHLRLQLSRQILASELAHLETVGAARLLATLTDDVQSVADAVRLIPFLCVDLAIAIGCLLYVTWLSWQVALFVFGFLSLFLNIYGWILRRAKQKLTLARNEQDRLFQHFRSVTDGTKELKLHYQRRQAFLQADLDSTAAAYRRYNIEGFSLFAIIVNWGKFSFFLVIGLVLFALPKLMPLTPQAFSGYILTFTYLIGPLESLISRLPILSRAGVALSKIESLNFSLGDRAEAMTPPPAPLAHWHRLELQQVTHCYPSDRDERQFTLGPIDLSFQPGELVFLVGGNGSGKSTLAKLLTGLYIPESGSLRLDGQEITAANREWYRQHFAVIFADFYLFDRLLGLDTPGVERQAQHYLKQLRLDHKVSLSHDRLSTIALSQGQRKRLALLTAYLEDRPIYLFDEWAADQDPEFKALFYRQLLPELRDRGKTVLVISHDDHYFHVADRLIKLDYGQVEYDKYLPGHSQ